MVELAADTRDPLGEGPVYIEAEGALRWVDILGGRWHRLTLATGKLETFMPDERLTAFAPIAESPDRFVGAFVSGIAVCDGQGRIERRLHQPEQAIKTNRFNDGGTDPAGRFIAGTMNEKDNRPTGSLYQLTERAELRTLRTGLGIANTIAFSPDGQTFYNADTATRELLAFAYDPSTGQLGERIETFKPSPDLPGNPDGSAVDAEGYLWNARWGGHAVLRLAPDGSLDRKLDLPVSQATSCAFVGTKLYITSARCGLNESRMAEEPWAGSLLVADVGIPGVPRPPVSKSVAAS